MKFKVVGKPRRLDAHQAAVSWAVAVRLALYMMALGMMKTGFRAPESSQIQKQCEGGSEGTTRQLGNWGGQ